MRQHHRHAARLRGHRFDHVLHPGIVAGLGGRHPGKVPPIRIAGPNLVAPFFQRERRIGDDAIKAGEAVASKKGRGAQGIAAHDLKIRRTMQEQVHPGDGGGGEIFLLAKQLAPQGAVVAVVLLHMVDGFQQHAARAASRIVNGLAFFRVEDVDHEFHNRARGVEFARLLVGRIGEFFDQILVRLAENIRLGRLIA